MPKTSIQVTILAPVFASGSKVDGVKRVPDFAGSVELATLGEQPVLVVSRAASLEAAWTRRSRFQELWHAGVVFDRRPG